MLRKAFDYSYEEIASLIEQTEPSVRQQVSRARKHLAGARQAEVGDGREQLLVSRREGIGRKLLLQFVDDARRLYAEQLFLEVRVSNRGAIALYEAVGFVAIARRVAYYPPGQPGGAREDALVMRCALSPSVSGLPR